MRRVASEIGVTQPVIYSAFAGGRQAIIDAVAISGFEAIATALTSLPPEPGTRMQAYLDFANAQPRLYEAMFSMPSGLEFGTGATPEVLQRAFTGIQEAFPAADDAAAELAWATVHGLATLEISGRLPTSKSQARLDHACRALTQESRCGADL
ncbi:TetR-like C-terminal domain-containing protein [Curtobacterium sp. MCJR17_020]|uniref:TetR-like C-terminal domain-containing protein n=1 Tax=Curtobacterium sp. MCJR17_020 TaxID=2175619 RepID=UPI0024DF4791|nr:TetR-like C-terminal domain-containing protein [Curtobacterium sp. MCJR17_020]WIE74206.1 TetR-like C-terminal domain-containing protein [Curtobacterium sp. MCJR17_020]